MNDVAAVARVSHQTVSRVLNGHPSVRPATRERVLAAIGELGYRRNSAARALVTRRTGTIGVLTTGSGLYGPSGTLIALEEAARESGYFVSLATIRQFDRRSMAAVLEHFMSQGVEGVIVIGTQDTVADAVDDFRVPVPVVLIAARPERNAADGGPPGSRTIRVAVDQRLGARMATDHLLGLGHPTVLHLSGPLDWFDARERRVGWVGAHVDAGLPEPELRVCDWSSGSGYQVGRAIAARTRSGGGPTAVFASNDQLALGLLHALAEAGVSVPGDVSVVGFDDVAGAEHFIPPLTTVRQQFDQLGRQSVAAMLGALSATPQESGLQLIPPVLVVRESTAPPPR